MQNIPDNADSVFFLERDFNCSETTLRLADQYYNLGISEEDFKLVSGFGGGCGCGLTCGCICSDIAVLGHLAVKERAHEDPAFKALCAKFCQEFEKQFGSTACSELKPVHFKPEIRCFNLIQANFVFLKSFIKENLNL